MALTRIPDHYPTEFATNWDHKCAQKMSKLENCVTMDTVEGDEKSYNKIGSVEFQQTSGRAEQTRESDVETERRWLRPYPFDSGANIFDKWDEKFLGQVSLPTSPLIEEHTRAYGRLLDSSIVQAGIGNAYIGNSGTTPIALPGTQEVAVNFVETGSPANSGMTLGKVRQAKFILDNNDVDDEEPRTLAYCAKQLNNMLRTLEVGSADYNDVKALIEGKINYFLGFTWKRVSNKILPIVGGVRTCVFWAKSGIRLAASGKETYMDILPTRNRALQIQSFTTVGATRDEEAKVGVIYCDETV